MHNKPYSKHESVGAIFKATNLRGSNFWDAILRDCDFTNAEFQGADLSKIFYDENTKWPRGIGVCKKEEEKNLTFQEELVMLLNKHGLKLSEPVKLETVFP